MLNVIMNNWGTIIVASALLCVISLIVVHIVKNKKAGKSSCGCGCSACPMSAECHKEKN